MRRVGWLRLDSDDGAQLGGVLDHWDGLGHGAAVLVTTERLIEPVVANDGFSPFQLDCASLASRVVHEHRRPKSRWYQNQLNSPTTICLPRQAADIICPSAVYSSLSPSCPVHMVNNDLQLLHLFVVSRFISSSFKYSR